MAELRSLLREKYALEIAGGQGKLSGKIFRLGHLGYIQESEILAAVGFLEMALISLGLRIAPGSATTAAMKIFSPR